MIFEYNHKMAAPIEFSDNLRHLDAETIESLGLQSILSTNTTFRHHHDHDNDSQYSKHSTKISTYTPHKLNSLNTLSASSIPPAHRFDDDEALHSKSRQTNRRYSLDSMKSNIKHLTLKEALFEIQQNVNLELPPPSYVPPLEQLPLELFQWNKKRAKALPKIKDESKRKKFFSRKVVKQYKLKYIHRSKYLQQLPCIINDSNNWDQSDDVSVMSAASNSATSVVANNAIPIGDQGATRMNERTMNIIGCQQPIEIILSKAYERSKKHKQRKDNLNRNLEEKREHTMNVIMFHNNIHERISKKQDCEQNQRVLLKALVMSQYIKNLRELHKQKCHQLISKRERVKNIARIAFKAMVWYNRSLQHKIKAMRNLRSLTFFINVRIRVKRAAVKKIILFLEESIKSQKTSRIVNHYLLCVRKVQQAIRDYLACRKERMNILLGLFTKYDSAYIKVAIQSPAADFFYLLLSIINYEFIFSNKNIKY